MADIEKELQEEMDPQPPKKKKRIWLRVFLIVLCVLLVLILVVGVAAVYYINQKLSLIQRPAGTVAPASPSEIEQFIQENTDPYDPDFTGPIYERDDIIWDTVPTEPARDEENVINILLVGQDRREGEYRARSDAMILCTLNKSQKTLTMTSFMRDLYVQIPGYVDHRINSSYAFGGAPLLEDCLEVNFDIQVDGCFEVDFDSFVDVIDAVGGVDIHLSEAEANYINNKKYWDSKYSGSYNADHTEGINHLTGAEALVYARNRSIGNSDFSRTQRQQKVLNAIVEKCQGMSIAQLNDMLELLLPMVTTDLTNSQIIDFAAQAIPILADLQVNKARIPVDGGYTSAWISGMSVLLPDLAANREALAEIMGE